MEIRNNDFILSYEGKRRALKLYDFIILIPYTYIWCTYEAVKR